MSEVMVIIGSAFLAFGPFVALFSLLVYAKAQLVIVVTSSAFFFLLSSLAASLSWTIFDTIGLGGTLAVLLPGILFQFVFRCAFVALYHRVEAVIQASLEKQHEEELEQLNQSADRTPETDASVRMPQNQHYSAEDEKVTWTEAAKLRLQLNDASCGVAAGIGFGGMHAVLLYGTLLASEADGNQGVLYQSSCPGMPSLAVSALYALAFTVLDVFWMLFTFFGMRRRLLFHRGQGQNVLFGVGSWFGNSRNGGNVALLVCLISHMLASMVTLANSFKGGCAVSIPALFAVVLVTAYLFWAGVGRIYMPPAQAALSRSRVVPTRLPNDSHTSSSGANSTSLLTQHREIQ